MALLTEKDRGVFVISVTPFNDDGTLDLNSLDRVTDFYLEAGATGLTILGMMGEAPKLTPDESKLVIQRVTARSQGKPVVVGVSAPGLAGLAATAKEAMDSGAAGVMIAPPMTLRTDAQILTYYRQACSFIGADVPVVLQDFPLATTVQISDELLGRLIDELPQIVMLKHEDFPGMRKLTQVREQSAAADRRRISILVGNGGLFLPQEMLRGADGAMTGFAYPEMLVQVCQLFDAGKPEEAEDLFDIYLPLLRHEFQYGIGLALRKETLRRRGAIRSAYVRRPGPVLDATDHAELGRLIGRLEAALG